jgi:hypothetical protein
VPSKKGGPYSEKLAHYLAESERVKVRENPGDVIEKTFENRTVGIEKLDDVELELHAEPKPGEVFIMARQKGKMVEVDAFDQWDGDPYVLFSEPIEVPVGGKPCLTNGAPFFTANRKMASISFGIPAGPVESVHGACPASALPDSYEKHYGLGDVDQRPMKYEEQICRKCYANKGNFMYELQQMYQTARFRWLKEQLKTGTSAERLADILTACVRTASQNKKKRASEGESPDFVRIHDSGDLFDLRYWRAWKLVCENLPHLQFWCPTRMWMLPVYTAEFQKGVPENLALRPSAYHFNESAPVIPGMAHGSTSNYWETKKGGLKIDPIKADIADWPCPAYVEVEGERGTSCSGALERVGKVWEGRNREALDQLLSTMSASEKRITNNCKDCRVCWLRDDMRVSYTAH